jgi:hypothetical protein
MPIPTRTFPAIVAAATLAMFGLTSPAAAQTFKAELTGAAMVPDPVKTPASGQLELTLAANGQSISYVLTVKDLENATEGDIHLGPAVANGPLVVKLYHGAAKKGPFSGVLAQGKIDAGDLIGSMAGAKLSELVDEIKAGNAYVNVHTSDGTDPPNSGPGDYRIGEIRGQIK